MHGRLTAEDKASERSKDQEWESVTGEAREGQSGAGTVERKQRKGNKGVGEYPLSARRKDKMEETRDGKGE